MAAQRDVRTSDGKVTRVVSSLKESALAVGLVALGIVAVGTFAALLATRDSKGRSTLEVELGKAALQVVVIVVLGTALKLLGDAYQARRQRAEQRESFRQDRYNRLVDGTNTLRRAQTLIMANRSVRTWGEQALAIVDAGLTLRRIKHEVAASDRVTDPPFPNWRALVYLLNSMVGYTEWVGGDLIAKKKELSEQQRRAEDKGLEDADRDRRQRDVWAALERLPSVADMLRVVQLEDVEERERQIRDEIAGLPPNQTKLRDPERSWAGYLALETVALDLVAEAVLPKAPRRAPG